MKVFQLALLIANLSLISISTFGQSVKFVSDVDKSLSIKILAVSPLFDNVSGIYAKPLDESVNNFLNNDHQWDVKLLDRKDLHTPEEFEANPNMVKDLLKKQGADALLGGRVSKGPKGVGIKLTLFSAYDGLPIATESMNEYEGFEITDLKNQTKIVLTKLKAKLPYQATVLSRKGQLVTINVGSSSGVRPGTEMTAVQILKVNRHPKYGFILGSENLILGKIHINKVDDYLSFGTVTVEKDVNAIGQGTKINANKIVTYENTDATVNGLDKPENSLAFGEKPTEWVPEAPPTFGALGLMIGLGSYTLNNSLVGSTASGTSQATPSIHLNGSIWLSPNWGLHLNIRDFVASVPNGLSGSSPSTINVSTAETKLTVGYNFLITDDFFGPKVQVQFGYSTMSSYVDNSSPTAYESNTYSGMLLGLSGSFPIEMKERKYPFYLGGKFNYYLSPSVSERPTSSGSGSSSQITNFALFGETRISERTNLKGELTFDLFSSNFSGAGSRATPASTTSHTITTFAAGVEYLF